MPLKKLADHDAERIAQYQGRDLPVKNGIGCPACGAELHDTNPNMTLTSDPPRAAVHCTRCGWQGTRLS